MFNSWFHIRLIAKYFQNILPGASLGKPFTYEKGRLHIPVNGCSQFEDLHFSIQQPLPFLSIAHKLPKPKNKVPIFRNLEGKQITQVQWHKTDRQILLICNNGTDHLLFQMFGISGNVLQLDSDFKIAGTFKKTKTRSIPLKSEFTPQDNLNFNAELLLKAASDSQSKTVAKFLSSGIIPVFSKTLIREICFRSKLSSSTLIANLKSDNLENLILQFQNILGEIKKTIPTIYFSSPPIFSLLQLQYLQNTEYENFDDLLNASQTFISTYFKWKTITQKKEQLTRKLENVLFSLQRKLNHQKRDIKNLPTADIYHEWADTILTNLNKIDKNISTVTLPKIDNPSETISIPLNNKLTAAKNAEKYYEKSRNVDSVKKSLLRAIEQTHNSIEKTGLFLTATKNSTEMKQLRTIEKQFSVTELLDRKLTPQGITHLPYHKFALGKFDILVGRSARDNDTLTFKTARPNDFWFHAQNVSGSHVILRNPQKLSSPPKNIIEKIAGVAAFYSKDKHSKCVSVIYALRKYVPKKRNSPPGVVSVKFEKSLIVEPFNPTTQM